MSIIIAILVFGIIIVVHEFGHFIAARKSGILVEEFAIGMGPILLKKQSGETLYTLRAFPMGGFCKMLGDEDGTSTDERAFNNQSTFKKICVILAGSFMNFVLAFILYLGVTSFVPITMPIIANVMPNTPAEQAGLQSGDRITRINTTRINVHDDMIFVLGDEEPTTIEVLRGNERIVKDIQTSRDESTGRYVLGISFVLKAGLFQSQNDIDIIQESIGTNITRATLLETLNESFHTIGFYIRNNVLHLGRLFTTQNSVDEMVGPIGIVSMIGDVYETTSQVSVTQTVVTMLSITAILSAAIGIFNLLPIPALDGARFMFLLIELVRRKPVDREKEGMVHFVGFIFLMMLAVFLAYNDISRIL